jgi:signal transduction histidine kinase
LTLRLEADPLEAKSLFDPDMLRQVLINLCENSAAAVADPGGTVTFTVRPEGRYHHVQVTDSGPGVAPALRAHLFEPYVTSAGVGEGMGLGLSISKKILLEHGGDLELIASEVGACFDLTLPADETRCPES